MAAISTILSSMVGHEGIGVHQRITLHPHDITLYAIDQEEDGPDLSALCPLRAFRLYWVKR